VADDTHVWSDQYDRVLRDIFVVQSEIASNVVGELNVTLLEPERAALEARPTTNMEAYQAYLRGRSYSERLGFDVEAYQMAVRMFQRAVELDPQFALAYAALSRAHSMIYNMGIDRTEERVLKTKAAVDRALELQPELPEAKLSLGYYYYHCFRDYEKALEAFNVAAEHLPNQDEILQHIGWIRRRQGRWDEALDCFNRSLQLNPRDPNLLFEMGTTYMWIHRYEEAESYYDRSIALAPDEAFGYAFKAINFWLKSGDLKNARITLERIPESNDPTVHYIWCIQHTLERDYSGVLDRLSLVAADMIELPDESIATAQVEGFIHIYAGRPERARASFETARKVLEREVAVRPDDGRIRSALGLVYAGLGRREAAIREAKLGVELLTVSEDALRGPQLLDNLASVYLILGEYDAAFDVIEKELSIPSRTSPALVRIAPRWDPVRDHPRFKALVDQ